MFFRGTVLFYFRFGTKINVDITVAFLALNFVGSWLIVPYIRFFGQIIYKN